MRRALPFLSLLLLGCVTDRVLALEIRPPRDAMGEPDIPADVVQWELRLERLDGLEGCGSGADAAAGRAFGRLGHAQTFPASDGMGAAVGEVPEGRWALRALARTEACEVRLYGCVELMVGEDAPDVVVLPVAPVDLSETCGCRTCAAGVCDPVDSVCE